MLLEYICQAMRLAKYEILSDGMYYGGILTTAVLPSANPSRGSKVKIIWTRHAEERQREWQKKLGITRQEVEKVLVRPEQIVPGDLGTFVAQSRRGDGLLRVPFAASGDE